MPTTIASPQNVIAVSVIGQAGTPVSFLGWTVFGLPVSISLVFLEWFYLMHRFPNQGDRLMTTPLLPEEKWSSDHTHVVLCALVTIILWTFGDFFSWFVNLGHIGIASMVPLVWLFGVGILTVNDFNSFKWSTLSLLGGGLVLGEAMRVSGLLDVISAGACSALGGIGTWPMLVVLLIVEGVLASLLSSTTAASIIFPVIMAIGKGTGHPALLVLLSALMISGSQLFHISSFPNALVSGVCIETAEEDVRNGITNGVPFLTGMDYIVYGAPMVVMGIVVIATLGYLFVTLIGF
jgi:phosphate transporter